MYLVTFVGGKVGKKVVEIHISIFCPCCPHLLCGKWPNAKAKSIIERQKCLSV